MPLTKPIDNSEDIIDSRDIIARIEDLESNDTRDTEEEEELIALRKVASQGEGYGDWDYGEQLIRHDYFQTHIEELINDCYEMPKDFQSGKWPWRHITFDYKSAAEEAEADYITIDLRGVEYFMRA